MDVVNYIASNLLLLLKVFYLLVVVAVNYSLEAHIFVFSFLEAGTDVVDWSFLVEGTL